MTSDEKYDILVLDEEREEKEMNARQKRMEVKAMAEQWMKEQYQEQDKPLFEFGIEKLTYYMKLKKWGLITASEYNLYRDTVEKFIGIK